MLKNPFRGEDGKLPLMLAKRHLGILLLSLAFNPNGCSFRCPKPSLAQCTRDINYSDHGLNGMPCTGEVHCEVMSAPRLALERVANCEAA